MADDSTETRTERYFTPAEIAEMLKLSTTTVRRMLENEPGVLRIRLGGEKNRFMRTRTTYRVPESVLNRILQKYTVKADYQPRTFRRGLRGGRRA